MLWKYIVFVIKHYKLDISSAKLTLQIDTKKQHFQEDISNSR